MDMKKPNLIVIMTDQQRFDTIAAHGHPHMITPNLDRFARLGVSFSQAYCPGATCVASRAAVFTGMYPHNTGVYSFGHWAHQRSWVHDLTAAGYHAVNIGKMHISPRDERMGFHERVIVENPTSDFLRNSGVDDDWGKLLSLHGRSRPLNRHRTDPQWRDKLQGIPWSMEEELHPDVFVADAAIGWIERHQPVRPVLLQIGFTGPHEPYDPLPRHLELYRERDVPLPVWREGELESKPPQHLAHQDFNNRFDHESQIAMPDATDEQLVEMRRHYYAKVTTVDEQLGRIMTKLEEKGYLEHALVLMMSDHGDMLGDHRLPYKWLMYDSVVRVPFLVWDRRRKEGAREERQFSWSSEQREPATALVHEKLVSLMDVGPTLLEAAGVAVPSYLEGRSLLGLLEGREEIDRPYVYCEDNYLTMVRSATHKLVHYTGQEEQGELYDLTDDPHELYNRFDDANYEEVKRKLQAALLQWLLQSTYRTAAYKTRQPGAPQLMPQQLKYLHPAPLYNPSGWMER
ncbi:sulfatase-like hydrolase/transferase [Paenibacillus sp. F411]|uniref:sulfatase-like hydrolase/transferase n=1 Tax=Paenibacillus sp. F411 TaxID=2820239 RepID=UPI001AAE9DE1|nr:sulfatase-like hydrolase/transferase [Paenibacillus sp. F411]MBO2944376.1 sulfatase-like hydrolase/transferase [Paenibacillus sp. F411]